MSRRTKAEIEADNLVAKFVNDITFNKERISLTPTQQAHVYNKLIMILIGRLLKIVGKT